MTKFFEETIQKVKLLAESGKNRKEVAAEMGMSQATLSRFMKQNPTIKIEKLKVGAKQKF